MRETPFGVRVVDVGWGLSPHEPTGLHFRKPQAMARAATVPQTVHGPMTSHLHGTLISTLLLSLLIVASPIFADENSGLADEQSSWSYPYAADTIQLQIDGEM